MRRTRRNRWLAWGALMLALGLALGLAGQSYQRLREQVERLDFQLTADRFQTAVSAVRAHYYLHGVQPEGVPLYRDLPGYEWPRPGADGGQPTRVYLNQAGWPAKAAAMREAAQGQKRSEKGSAKDSAEGRINRRAKGLTKADAVDISAHDCQGLWQAFLYPAPKTRVRGKERLGKSLDARYRVSVTAENVCRYRLIGADAYIDYSPSTGAVRRHDGRGQEDIAKEEGIRKHHNNSDERS